MPAMWGILNRAATGVLTASAALPSAPAANLSGPHGDPASSWQTPAGTTTATVRIDGGVGATWRLFAVCNANFSGTAIVQWTVSDNPDMSSPTYYSGNVVGVSDRQTVHVAPTEVVGRYCQVRIVNASVADGYLRAANLWAGPAIEMRRGLSYESAWDRTATQETQTTRGGQEYPITQFQRRGWGLRFGSVPAAEFAAGVATLDAVIRAGNSGDNVLFIPFSTQTDTINRDAILGLLRPSAVGYVNGTGLYRSWSARITERL